MGRKSSNISLGKIFQTHNVEEFQNKTVKSDSNDIKQIPINLIEANPFQPRREFNDNEIKELANSIQEQGLLQPILLRKNGEKYQIVMGERRFRAVRSLGLETIRAGVLDKATDRQMMEWALIENIQRVQLSSIEEALAYEQLIRNCDYTHDQIAKNLGKSRSNISNTLRLLKLTPKIQTWIQNGDLSAGHARNLIKDNLEDPEALAEKIITEGLSVRQVEALFKENPLPSHTPSDTTDTPPTVIKMDPNLVQLEDEIRYLLGSNVKIQSKTKGGQIQIPYSDITDLNRIWNLIRQDS
jgi:ParB family transcriptional regulator, chromosome partitioning protein